MVFVVSSALWQRRLEQRMAEADRAKELEEGPDEAVEGAAPGGVGAPSGVDPPGEEEPDDVG